MTTDTQDLPETALAPAALPAALRNRLLAAMQEAAAGVDEDAALEARLRRCLSPAPMPPRMQGRLGVQMCLQAVQERRKWYSFLLQRSGAMAASLVLGVGCALAFYGGGASASTPQQGLVSRSVLDSRGGADVVWENATPVRRYDVVYEDALVIEDEEGMTIMVRVPNRRMVTVEEEVL